MAPKKRAGGTASAGAQKKPKGHWPAGKRRNDPGKDWPRVLAKLQRVTAEAEADPNIPLPQRRSIKGCAAAIGVDAKTVARYVSGWYYPTEETAASIKDWLASLKTRGSRGSKDRKAKEAGA